MQSMRDQYGSKKGESVFYASKNKGAIKGVEEAKKKDDKWIQGAQEDIERRGTEGKCTPITKPGCTGRAKALAKTFN